ncbi:MAG: hypothetical protein GX138_07265 [Firmicutes bacterium]|nr:hypothetical protein [Bacillota bacterium]
MPRKPRELSATGFYHITIRGNNEDKIFLDADDYNSYLNYAARAKEKAGIEIHAYCLLDNHIQFLLKADDQRALRTFFSSLGAGFVSWYNKKYNRSGHLFQGRYSSKPIEDEEYYKAVLRYIHQLPVKSGFSQSILDYTHSSIYEYKKRGRICEVRHALSLFGKPWYSAKTRRAFIRSQNDSAEQVVCPFTPKTKRNLKKQELIALFYQSDCSVDWDERLNLSKDELFELARFFKNQGVSYLQIEKHLGLSRYALKKQGI